MSHSCFNNLTDEQVTSVHNLINFLRLLHIIGEIKFSVTKSNDKYSMQFKSYDIDKRKRGLIHMARDLNLYQDKNKMKMKISAPK